MLLLLDRVERDQQRYQDSYFSVGPALAVAPGHSVDGQSYQIRPTSLRRTHDAICTYLLMF